MAPGVGDLLMRYGVLSGIAVYILALAAQKFFSGREQISSSGARTDVIEMLSAQVREFRDSVAQYKIASDIDRKARLEAEDEMHEVRRRLRAVEVQLVDQKLELEAERSLRVEAEAEVAQLKGRVGVLEEQIRGLGHEPRRGVS